MEPIASDSLRYSRQLADVVVPKPPAEVMVEAFGYYTREIAAGEYLQTTLRTEFAEQTARLERSILSQVDRRFEQLDKPFATIDGRLDQIDTRLTRVESQPGQMDLRLDSVEQRLETVASKEKSLSATGNRMDKMLHLHSWILGGQYAGGREPLSA